MLQLRISSRVQPPGMESSSFGGSASFGGDRIPRKAHRSVETAARGLPWWYVRLCSSASATPLETRVSSRIPLPGDEIRQRLAEDLPRRQQIRDLQLQDPRHHRQLDAARIPYTGGGEVG
jgi:hypothetical protein